jgi:dephospho-CoA kinase
MAKAPKIGVTGGMGVGKTSVCRIFESFGIPIYNADIRAKALMTENESVRRDIEAEFGWDAYHKDGSLNRTYLAKIVFDNPEKLEKLNSIVHPRVFDDYNSWVAGQTDAPYTIKEAALMFETDSYKQLDEIIVVTCPINIRIERIMKRDHAKREDVLKRINNQMTDKERLKRAHYIIRNDGSESLIHQSIDIHQQILQKTKRLAYG